MPGHKVKDNEPISFALKRFKRQCERAGTLSEVRERQFYEKPSVKRKRMKDAAKRREYARRHSD